MSDFCIYQTVTDKLISMLETGCAPWRSPILGRKVGGSFPKNLASGKEYRGVNVFLLAVTAMSAGYESSYWMSYNQAKERGGQVRKGEKSSMVVFWKPFEVKDKATGEKKKAFILRYYNVFNVAQIEGVEAPDVAKFEPVAFSPNDVAEKIVAGYKNPPTMANDGGGQAYYRPSDDSVHMPIRERVASSDEYYSVLFHELSHSTGHATRLSRTLDGAAAAFGSSNYGKEELIAEMSAAFLCGHSGILPSTIDNNAAYLAGWIKTLKGDKRLVVAAAGAAQRSADWIMGNRPDYGAE